MQKFKKKFYVDQPGQVFGSMAEILSPHEVFHFKGYFREQVGVLGMDSISSHVWVQAQLDAFDLGNKL